MSYFSFNGRIVDASTKKALTEEETKSLSFDIRSIPAFYDNGDQYGARVWGWQFDNTSVSSSKSETSAHKSTNSSRSIKSYFKHNGSLYSFGVNRDVSCCSFFGRLLRGRKNGEGESVMEIVQKPDSITIWRDGEEYHATPNGVSGSPKAMQPWRVETRETL